MRGLLRCSHRCCGNVLGRPSAALALATNRTNTITPGGQHQQQHQQHLQHRICISFPHGSTLSENRIFQPSLQHRQYSTQPLLANNIVGNEDDVDHDQDQIASPITEETEGEGETVFTSGVTLRPYQNAAIEACINALQNGIRRIGVSSPTGSGKTTMFMNLIPRIVSLYDQSKSDRDRKINGRGRTLIVVGSVELAQQTELAAKRLLGDDWIVEVEQSKRVASGLAHITIATYQTLNNIGRLAKFDPATFALVIVDEAHHAAALSYLRLLHYFNEAVQLPSTLEPITSAQHGNKVPIVGFSATFSRPDQLALSAVFEDIVFHRDITSMLEEGWLAPAKSTTVLAELQLDQVELNQKGDFNTSSLARNVNTPAINDLVLRTYLHRAVTRRSTLIFCVDLAHVADLTDIFREAGIDARSISSLTKTDLRRGTLASFGRGEFPVLINCEVLTEGTDIPEIDCIILARPTKSRNLLAQMVGRGLRLSPETGKENCHIIDIVDSVSRANGMLVSPTLWGLSHDDAEIKEREDVTPGERGAEDKNEITSIEEDYNITFIDQDDPFGVAGSSRPILTTASQNAWVACGKRKYLLELIGNGFIAIEPSTSPIIAKWNITIRRAIPPEIQSRGTRSPYGRVQIIGHAEDLERALQTADKYAERTLGRELSKRLSKYASWRSKPASVKAVKLFLKISGQSKERARESAEAAEGIEGTVFISGKQVAIRNLTAGQVSSWLCAAKHGAKTMRDSEDRKEDRRRIKEQVKAEKKRLHQSRNLPFTYKSLKEK